jgi:thiamine-monophosphate kinase
MRVKDLGEFPLIERLRQITAVEQADIVVGIGDDVAVLNDGSPQGYLLATVDSMVEDVHFLRYLTTPEQLGRRALAINLSDIAAVGGQAQFALVALVLPDGTNVPWIEGMYRGMQEEAARAGVAVVGGNITSSPSTLSIHITVLGRVQAEHMLLRSGARPGDRILVTGSLGSANAGLRLARATRERQGWDAHLPPAERQALLDHYLTPTPRLREAAAIAATGGATAMIDISDGLSSDLGHICEQSQVGAHIAAVHLPISDAAQQVATALALPPEPLALTGGDDYELCFTAAPERVADIRAAVQQATGTPVTDIGEIVPAERGRILTLPDGRDVPLEAGGWQHFRSETQPS